MPGIFGVIGVLNIKESAKVLGRMCQSMQHENFYKTGKHLSVEEGLHVGWVCHQGAFSDCQPIWNEDREICLIYSGENFIDQDQVACLRSKGHDFEGDNASYLVHLYEENEAQFFEFLNGTFSGILLDRQKSKVVLFNDRYGLDRIYYHECQEGFYFASEAKALLSVKPALRELDYKSLGDFFSCGCPLQNRSLYKGINLLPAASKWTFKKGKTSIREFYFKFNELENQERLSPKEFVEAFKNTWRTILPRYFKDQEKLGISLTGGKDSRMIMAWLPEFVRDIPCYTFGSMYRECEDVRLARQVAERCSQSHNVIEVGCDFLDNFPELAEETIYLSDGSMDVSGATELYANRRIRKISKIRLTGNYGQEILRGSIAFKPIKLNLQLFHQDLIDLIDSSEETYSWELNGHKRTFIVEKQMPWHHYARLSLEKTQVTMRSPYIDNDFVSLAFRTPEIYSKSIQTQLGLIMDGNMNFADIGTDRGMQNQSRSHWLSKANCLFKQFTFKAEYAYDYGMPQWLAAVDYFLKPFKLERLMLGNHKFYHFRVWYRDWLSKYVKEILLDAASLNRPYLNKSQVEKIVIDHTSGRGNYTIEIHKLITSELVQRLFIDYHGDQQSEK